jgi:hypothetical protein
MHPTTQSSQYPRSVLPKNKDRFCTIELEVNDDLWIVVTHADNIKTATVEYDKMLKGSHLGERLRVVQHTIILRSTNEEMVRARELSHAQLRPENYDNGSA